MTKALSIPKDSANLSYIDVSLKLNEKGHQKELLPFS